MFSCYVIWGPVDMVKNQPDLANFRMKLVDLLISDPKSSGEISWNASFFSGAGSSWLAPGEVLGKFYCLLSSSERRAVQMVFTISSG